MAAHTRSTLPRGDTLLSPREIAVATLMGRGFSNREIADHLSISIATVERHASNIFNKLGFHSRTQVAVWAADLGLPGIDHT
jgi:DNA-binding NarL/FixJ family response regulator